MAFEKVIKRSRGCSSAGQAWHEHPVVVINRTCISFNKLFRDEFMDKGRDQYVEVLIDKANREMAFVITNASNRDAFKVNGHLDKGSHIQCRIPQKIWPDLVGQAFQARWGKKGWIMVNLKLDLAFLNNL